MSIESVMKSDVVSIDQGATLGQALDVLTRHRIGMLPVVDADGKLLGVLRLRAILQLLLPAFVGMVDDYDFVEDFGALEHSAISVERRAAPVTEVMDPPHAVVSGCGLLRAHAFMRQHDLHDLPVVDDRGRLIGLASWVDVGIGFLEGPKLGGGA